MESLHRLRSALARVQGEGELLALDGADTASLMEGVADTFSVLEAMEESRGLRGIAVVLEDEERLGLLTVKALCRRGVAAVLALSVDSALALAGAGATLVADLSALDSAGASAETLRLIRPIVVSGAASGEARRRAETLAARAYLLKPVDVDALAGLLGVTPAAEGR